jgi:hypothetical protein
VSSRRTLPIRTLALAALATTAACGGESTGLSNGSFLRGTSADPDIGVVLSTTSPVLTVFQAGAPQGDREVISLSAGTGSTAPTPVGFFVRGTRVAVPLGNAPSVAVVDLDGGAKRFFTFESGNTTGAAWLDDNTILAANTHDDYVGKIDLRESATTITQTVDVTATPTAIVVANGLAYVVSANYNDAYTRSLGNGVVSELDPATMKVLRTATVGLNPTDAALGPDGKLYVLNTGDYVAAGNVSIVNPTTMQVEQTVGGFGVGPGAIDVESDGRAYVSGFAFGTLVWDTNSRTFVRGTNNPVCARTSPAPGSPCRGATDTDVGSDGRLYQTFFGETNLRPYVFVYAPSTYQLTDSVDVGVGPYSIDVRSFR